MSEQLCVICSEPIPVGEAPPDFLYSHPILFVSQTRQSFDPWDNSSKGSFPLPCFSVCLLFPLESLVVFIFLVDTCLQNEAQGWKGSKCSQRWLMKHKQREKFFSLSLCCLKQRLNYGRFREGPLLPSKWENEAEREREKSKGMHHYPCLQMFHHQGSLLLLLPSNSGNFLPLGFLHRLFSLFDSHFPVGEKDRRCMPDFKKEAPFVSANHALYSMPDSTFSPVISRKE